MSAPQHNSRRLYVSSAAWSTAALLSIAFFQPPSAFSQSQPGQAADQAELTSHEAEPTFKLRSERNLVQIRVVVRDSKGKPVGDLRQEDFRLLDNGKPQVISHFTVEGLNAAHPNAAAAASPSGETDKATGAAEVLASAPRRFVVLFFDDVHMQIEDTMRVKLAAAKFLSTSVLPGDRLAVSTGSGRIAVDFTNDMEKVRATIDRIQPHPVIEPRSDSCPDVFDYQAYKIVNQNDQFAIDVAYQEYYHCECEQYEGEAAALQLCTQRGPAMVQNAAVEALNLYQTNSQSVLQQLQHAVRSLATYPGERALLLVSPGFLTATFETELDRLVDSAIHANITVNALDARGLYAPMPGGDDISKRPIIVPRRPDVMGQKELIRFDRLMEIEKPLSILTNDTGGAFFHNNNDLEEGYRIAAAAPQVYYVLAFSPTSLKADGRLHSLKVNVLRPGTTVQSRSGYFAPSGGTDPASKAKQEIEEAIFSQDSINELPVDVHTQFFRVDQASAKLSVLTHVNLGGLRFRKQDGRNLNNLTLVTALFDNNGQIVKSEEKTVEMRFRDATLTRIMQSGITMKAVFDVKPGTYLVREVVRDTEGAQLSGLNRTVDIPY